jgi:hypothetical protein
MVEVHQGGCVCGENRYRVHGKPKRISACSCTWCQKRTGSALGVSVYFLKKDVDLDLEPLGRYRLTNDAGRWIEQVFCRNCGTALAWTLEFLPEFRGIAGGTFDPPAFWFNPPQRLVFARSKPDWLHLCDDVPVFEAMAPSS